MGAKAYFLVKLFQKPCPWVLWVAWKVKIFLKISKFLPEMAMLLGGALLKVFMPVFNCPFASPLVLLTLMGLIGKPSDVTIG